MALLPQPPPDAPAPPPGKEAIRSRNKMSGIVQLGVFSIFLLILIILAQPVVRKSRKASDLTEAMNNIRQVGLALTEFEADYGRFPEASTIPAVHAATGTALDLNDTSSNGLFRQLIATGFKSEKPFWARTAGSSRKPDDIFNAADKALQAGEVGFTYLTGLSSKSHRDAPVVLAPVNPGTLTFDRKPYKGYAIVLRVDQSARRHPIDPKTNRVMLNGMDIFDPRQPFWGGKMPEVRWPE